jgi:ketosteroid isomerase-like protein
MSEENVEVVRRGYEAFNRGDLDGMVADFAPWEPSTTTLELGLPKMCPHQEDGIAGQI